MSINRPSRWDRFLQLATVTIGASGLSAWLATTIVGRISKDDGFTPLGALQRVIATALDDR